MFALANPERFMRFTRPLTPVLWAAAAVLLAVGAWLSFVAPEDYQQGDTVRIMFVHVPAASLGLMVYGALGVASRWPMRRRARRLCPARPSRLWR